MEACGFRSAQQLALEEVDMERKLYRPDGSLYVTIYPEPEEGWIYVDWEGFLQIDMVKEGSEELLAMIRETGLSKVLISNKKISGPWNKANEWYSSSWNPRAEAAGLKYMGVIISDNIFSQLSLQGFEKLSDDKYKVFSHYDAEVVKNWLRTRH